MSEKKPSVFPNQEMINQANETGERIQNQVQEENPMVPEGERKAAQEMYERTQEQLKIREEKLALAKQQASATEEGRAKLLKEAREQKEFRDNMHKQNYVPPQPPSTPTPPTTPPTGSEPSGEESRGLPPEMVRELCEPQWDAPFDLIPLPSEGKLYKGVKPQIKVAFLNASDENLLTSPHILESEHFLEILFSRKILEPNLKYGDLHVGDRNAIMIWLRATAYGTDYPITVLDELGNPFESDFDLTELQTKKLGAEPDAEGLFSYTIPSNGNVIKFKMLSTDDVDSLERMLEHEKDVLKLPINNGVTYTLQKHIVEINGERDLEKIKSSIEYMRIADRKGLIKYIDSIESGLDLTITVTTPSGESVTTFLPLNLSFFWPDFNI